MNLFWQEYLHFIVAMFVILVSLSSGLLFFITAQYEKVMRTTWRGLGFIGLAVAFFLYILERKYSAVGLGAIIVEVFSLFAIYKGVLAEPKLSHLMTVGKQAKDKLKKQSKKVEKKSSEMSMWMHIDLFLLALAFVIVIAYLFFSPFWAAVGVVLAMVCILRTIQIQVDRYNAQKKDGPEVRRNNLYPLVGYIFLFARSLVLFLYRLPDLDVVLFYKLNRDYSIVWLLAVIFTFFAFFFLALWAWRFIKVRVFLRMYVVLLAIAILISSLGTLVFSLLIFRVVENNNLELMAQGAQAEQVIMEERLNTALFIARTISKDVRLVRLVNNNNFVDIENSLERYLTDAELDILRIYSPTGEVIVSSSDPRDQGRVFNDDSLVAYTISSKKQIKSYAIEPGVLAPVVVARALHPLLVQGEVIGAVETGYKFDNAFVDFSKMQTDLDVTVYSQDLRSATTIKTLDGVSRWVGTKETDNDIVKTVLAEGKNYRSVTDRLGQVYYSAFEPIREINGSVIGMVSVGKPTALLFKDTRAQLITAFLIAVLISIFAALIGALIMRHFRRTIN